MEFYRNAVRIVSTANKLIVCYIINAYSRKIHSESSTDHCAEVIVVCLQASFTNDTAGKTSIRTNSRGILIVAQLALIVTAINIIPSLLVEVVKCLHDKLGIGLFCIIEFNVLAFTRCFFCCRNSGDVCIEHTEHFIHYITDSDGFNTLGGNFHTVCSVHKTNENDLTVGIELCNTANNALIVNKEARSNICNCVTDYFEIVLFSHFRGNNSSQLFHNCIVYFKHTFLRLLGFEKLKSHFKCYNIFRGKRTSHNTDSPCNVLNHICTERCITDAKSYNIRILYSVCEVLRKNLIIINTCIVIYLAKPTVCRHFATAQKVEQILGTHSRGRKLGVIYIVTLFFQIFLKLQGIGTLAIYSLTGQEIVINSILAL